MEKHEESYMSSIAVDAFSNSNRYCSSGQNRIQQALDMQKEMNRRIEKNYHRIVSLQTPQNLLMSAPEEYFKRRSLSKDYQFIGKVNKLAFLSTCEIADVIALQENFSSSCHCNNAIPLSISQHKKKVTLIKKNGITEKKNLIKNCKIKISEIGKTRNTPLSYLRSIAQAKDNVNTQQRYNGKSKKKALTSPSFIRLTSHFQTNTNDLKNNQALGGKSFRNGYYPTEKNLIDFSGYGNMSPKETSSVNLKKLKLSCSKSSVVNQEKLYVIKIKQIRIPLASKKRIIDQTKDESSFKYDIRFPILNRDCK